MKKVNSIFAFLFFIFSFCSHAQVSENIYPADGINAEINDAVIDHVAKNYATAHLTVSPDRKKTATAFSLVTDYFRSVQTGNWGAISTWESSPDNGVTAWAAATLTPTSASNTIQIRNGHTVTVSTNQDMDQVIIESGGILVHSANTLTVNDGAGDDIIVQNGGIFTLAVNPSVTFSAIATANINTGGMLRLSATGLMAAGTGVHANNYIYQHASILEYTLSFLFSTDGVTVFPNVDAVTIPVFRITGNIGAVGASTTTTINGLFEANGNITFQNTGTKIFRNGIIGPGNVNGSTSGKFIINGSTASLGGTGLLTLPAAGMDIGNTTTVTMVSNNSVAGNINLLLNALVMLGTFNLTITGIINGGSATSHIVTNSTGKLVINNIAATPVIFPVGANTTTVNPMAIFNGGGLNYGIRVAIGINPNIAVPLQAVNRTWFVTPTGGTPGTVNTNFFYYAGDGNAGFNYGNNLELGLYTTVWNVIQTGLMPAGMYQVPTTISNFGNNIESPLVLANLGAILSSSNSVSVDQFTGIKQNSNHLLNWKLTCNSSSFADIELERSTDGQNYKNIYSMHATALRCRQPFDHTDAHPAAGVNYYRLKIRDDHGKISYSSIVSLLNAATGFDILNIAPNPVAGSSFDLKISAAKAAQMEIIITDMQGRLMQKKLPNLIAGFNIITVNVSRLAKGTYQLYGNTADGRTRVLRFAIQ